jgi:hypothetical protein
VRAIDTAAGYPDHHRRVIGHQLEALLARWAPALLISAA